jgi:hypothetical protein
MKKINEEEIHKAVEWLKESAGMCAEAKATRYYLEAFSKSLKALLMSRKIDLPISAQERDAYSSKEYQDHLKAVKIAIERDEKNKYLRESALVKIETWRTQEANYRAIKL